MSRLKNKPVRSFTKDDAKVSVEFCTFQIGKGHWEKFKRTDKMPERRNPFHRGSRCWHAYERGYDMGWRIAAVDAGLLELVEQNKRKADVLEALIERKQP